MLLEHPPVWNMQRYKSDSLTLNSNDMIGWVWVGGGRVRLDMCCSSSWCWGIRRTDDADDDGFSNTGEQLVKHFWISLREQLHHACAVVSLSLVFSVHSVDFTCNIYFLSHSRQCKRTHRWHEDYLERDGWLLSAHCGFLWLKIWREVGQGWRWMSW